MSNIKFDFNPLTPVSSGGGKFPWSSILFGLGLLAIIIVIAYEISKPETQVAMLISDEELSDDEIDLE